MGEAWLLGGVLNGFLAARAPMNTCFQTEIVCLAAERSFRWAVHDGTAPSL
jgi:type VI protein secretion system component VasA